MAGRLTVNLDPLRAAIAGDVVAADEPGWDQARQAWNLVADQHPALIVVAASVEDVATTVRFAGANGLRVAVQSTGHGATSMSELTGTILLRTSRLAGVAIDPQARTATVQAGTSWRDVILAAGQHGLICLHGMSGGVGVAGYVLGGGIGWVARREGFASSHVRSLDVVTADGDQRRVDGESEPELFWALRGGGGRPAIVTSFELELFALRQAFAGALVWPIEQATEIVHAYHAWIADLPDTVTSTLRLMRLPDLPAVPEPLRAKSLVVITLAFTGGEAEGNELVAPLRSAAAPYLDTVDTIPAMALGEISGDPQDPMPGIGRALLLDRLTADALDAYVGLAGPAVSSPLTSLEIRHLGAALRTTSPDLGPAGPLDAEALVYGVGTPVTRELGVAIGDTLDELSDRFSPWVGERRTLLTFNERGAGLREAFTTRVADRLATITATYDPDGLLVANHVVD